MTLKIIFLIISIIVLTIDSFVKAEPTPNKVTADKLNKFKNLYKDDIIKYCEKNQILTNDKTPDMLAGTLLYFKDVYDELSRYDGIFDDSNTFIDFMISKNKIQLAALVEKDANTAIKKNYEKSQRQFYKTATFCSLPEEIKDEYFLERFQYFYDCAVANYSHNMEVTAIKVLRSISRVQTEEEDKVYSDNYLADFAFQFTSTTFKEFIPLYIEELHLFDQNTFPKDKDEKKYVEFKESIVKNYNQNCYSTHEVAAKKYLKYHFEKFKEVWTFLEFDPEEFFVFLILDKNTTNDTDYEAILPDFLKIFKESLDTYYKITTRIDIEKKLSDEQKTFYYKQMLRGMKNIYNAYEKKATTRLTLTEFVTQMTDVAESIRENNLKKTKNKDTPNDSSAKGGHQAESDFVNDEIIVKTYYRCKNKECALPHKVNFKDVLEYMIHQKKSPTWDTELGQLLTSIFALQTSKNLNVKFDD